MILGVDHVALSCQDINDGAKVLIETGYRLKFLQEAVPNHPAKRHLLKSYEPGHSLAYLQADQSISVELTQHSSRLDAAPSPYQVFLDGCPPHARPCEDKVLAAWASVWQRVLGCGKPAMARLAPLNAQFWYDAHDCQLSRGQIRALMVPVSDLARAERFWCGGLRCHLIQRGTGVNELRWSHIAFRAPVPTWSLMVILAEVDKTAMPYLDDPGFPCLALISNRLTMDKESLLKVGAHDISEEFPLVVGQKCLKIVIMRGPDNELIELIQLDLDK
jgi:catechol 2,3-dioxygenase-like lactoylglutathione lyase family enzyme